MLAARAFTLPLEHPTSHVFAQSSSASSATWVQLLDDFRTSKRFGVAVPSLVEACGSDCVGLARMDLSYRHRLLRSYRDQFVRPAMDALDDAEFQAARADPKLPCPLPCSPTCNSLLILHRAAWSPTTWTNFKAWSLCRVTGRLPLCCFGLDDMPAAVATCPWCLCPHVDLMHFCVVCTHRPVPPLADRHGRDASSFLAWLFSGPPSTEQELQVFEHRADFVGRTFSCAVEAPAAKPSPDGLGRECCAPDAAG